MQKKKKETKELQQTYDMRTQRDVPPTETQNKCKKERKELQQTYNMRTQRGLPPAQTQKKCKKETKKQRNCNKPMI